MLATLNRPAPAPRAAHPSENWTLLGLFRAYRSRILLTYFLFNIENLLRLAQPLAVGLAINDLLRSSWTGVAVFVAQHLAHLLVSTARRMYDTRAFTSIYTDLASHLVLEQRAQGVEVSRVAARSALSRALVDFFEHDLPQSVQAAYSVFGAVAMLCFYDPVLVPLCLCLLVPAYLLNRVYGRKTLLLNGRLHDEFEREVGVVERADVGEVREHYSAVSRWRIKLSDWEALNFGLMELFVLTLLAVALVRSCGLPGIEAGDIFAVFRYVLMFVAALDGVPFLVQQMTRMRDIQARMRQG